MTYAKLALRSERRVWRRRGAARRGAHRPGVEALRRGLARATHDVAERARCDARRGRARGAVATWLGTPTPTAAVRSTPATRPPMRLKRREQKIYLNPT